jgi:hypothetical protein
MKYPEQPLIKLKQDIEGQQLVRLNLGVPPMFEEALGYSDDARFVAFFCGHPRQRTVFYTDGQIVQPGNYQAWQLWFLHPSAGSELRGYDFGNDNKPATHWLLLDRDERDFYVGNTGQVERFLSSLPGAMRTTLAWLMVRKRLYGRQRIRQPLTARQKLNGRPPPKPDQSFTHNRQYLAMRIWLDH